jgi:hypothetical protein
MACWFNRRRWDFYLRKSGIAGLEITVDLRDEHCLYIIKQRFGGSIKLKSGARPVRSGLHHKEGLINLINSSTAVLRNPTRSLQFIPLCLKYGIEYKDPLPLTYNDGWLSGFLDADGVYLSIKDLNK